jgi:tetratricopeptide (TPR) repeat protein
MLKVKCSVCGKILSMKDTSKTDDRILCVDCYEKLTSTQETVASEFGNRTGPTVCGRCGFDNGSNPLPTLATLPMCQQCTDYLRNRPFPSWIKTSLAGLIILVVLAAVWNMRFFLAWEDTRVAFKLMGQGMGQAAERMKGARNRVPESSDLQAFSAFLDGVVYLQQDRPKEALASLEKCRHRLPSTFGVDILILQAKAGMAFDAKDYDGFLVAAKEMISKKPDVHFSYAMLASAYACKYAVTSDLAFREQAMAALERARAMSGSNPSFKEYEQRILHRLNTQEILTPQEFHTRFPNGWQQEKE